MTFVLTNSTFTLTNFIIAFSTLKLTNTNMSFPFTNISLVKGKLMFASTNVRFVSTKLITVQLRVPDKFSGRREGEVAHVLRGKL